ncbi:hypothetical protein K503DRAFT_859606, partial [Rhizopogon vinicolor AM-OR11-026]
LTAVHTKLVAFALKCFSKCGEDLWECIIEECQKGSINHRINILYFLDSLRETSLLAKAHQPPEQSSSSKQANKALYVDYVSRDLTQVVECVVPVDTQRQIRPQRLHLQQQNLNPISLVAKYSSVSRRTESDINAFENDGGFKRNLTLALQSLLPRLASFLPLSDAENAELALDIEFENE